MIDWNMEEESGFRVWGLGLDELRGLHLEINLIEVRWIKSVIERIGSWYGFSL